MYLKTINHWFVFIFPLNHTIIWWCRKGTDSWESSDETPWLDQWMQHHTRPSVPPVLSHLTRLVRLLLFVFQGKYMDLEFDFKGDPIGGVISNCEFHNCSYNLYCLFCIVSAYLHVLSLLSLYLIIKICLLSAEYLRWIRSKSQTLLMLQILSIMIYDRYRIIDIEALI